MAAITTSITGLGMGAAADALLANDIVLAANFSGTSAPTAVAGRGWYKSDDKILAYYDGSGWVEVGTVLHADVDYQKHQFKNCRTENLSSDPTPASDVVGWLSLNTTRKKLKVVVSSTVQETVISVSNVDYWCTELGLDRWKKGAGAAAPDDITVGTTPTIDGYLFDDTTVRARCLVRVPKGYSGDANLLLRIYSALNQDETANDDEDWQVDRISIKPRNDEKLSATSVQETATQDLGSSIHQYAVNYTDIVLDFDGSVPIEAGDLLVLEIGRTNLTQVGAVIFLGAQLLSPCGDFASE